MRSILLGLLVVFMSEALPKDKATQHLVKKGGGGPDEKWVGNVVSGLHKLKQKKKSKLSRQSKGISKELKNQLAEIERLCGPKSNITSTSEKESHPDMANVTLEGDMIPSPEHIEYLLSGGSKVEATTEVPDETSSPETPETPDPRTGITPEATGMRKRREAITDPTLLWDLNTPVPYTIDSSLSSIRDQILTGIKFWNDNTCLTFAENANAVGRLHYYRGSGCWSYIGKQKNWTSQDVSIGSGCESFGTICHETAHALGFYHTQSRYDRDDFITVNFNNIQQNLQYNFNKQTNLTETHFGLPYDYGSVMQYNPYAFAIDYNTPTSVAKNAMYQSMMGQRDWVSFSDVKQMNLLYKCANQCSSGAVTCQNNGIISSKTCNSCICPRYFTGNNCQNLATGSAPVCNQQTVKAISTPQTLNATVGLGMTYVYYNDFKDCYWMIQAPAGKKIQFNVVANSANCMQGCNWGGFEINTGNLDLSGFLNCCASISSQTFTSTSPTVIIRGYSRYNNVNLMVQYTAV